MKSNIKEKNDLIYDLENRIKSSNTYIETLKNEKENNDQKIEE